MRGDTASASRRSAAAFLHIAALTLRNAERQLDKSDDANADQIKELAGRVEYLEAQLTPPERERREDRAELDWKSRAAGERP